MTAASFILKNAQQSPEVKVTLGLRVLGVYMFCLLRRFFIGYLYTCFFSHGFRIYAFQGFRENAE